MLKEINTWRCPAFSSTFHFFYNCTLPSLQHHSVSMVHINELPDLILANIFYWVCNNHECLRPKHYTIKRWKTKLVLLAVCRVWRKLAIPSVHKASFVRCICFNGYNGYVNMPHNYFDSEDSDELSISNELHTLQTGAYVVKSNLDIVSSIHWARTIQIYVNTCDDPMHCLRNFIETIRKHKALLGRVRKVEVFVNLYRTIVGDRNTHPISIEEASAIGKEFCLLVPSVQFVELFGDSNAPEILGFAESLIKDYAYQLTGFAYPIDALGKVHAFSDNLKLVEIDGNYSHIAFMPNVCAENITVLNLEYIRSDFDWNSFEREPRSRCLYFANLKCLQLSSKSDFSFDDGEIDDLRYASYEFNYEVIAPKLETLILQLCPFTFSFLSSIHGLATINYVELETKEVTVYFTELNLDIARDPFASYAIDSQEHFQAINMYAYMNDMLNISNLAKSTKAWM